jgi:hypothetical protein
MEMISEDADGAGLERSQSRSEIDHLFRELNAVPCRLGSLGPPCPAMQHTRAKKRRGFRMLEVIFKLLILSNNLYIAMRYPPCQMPVRW